MASYIILGFVPAWDLFLGWIIWVFGAAACNLHFAQCCDELLGIGKCGSEMFIMGWTRIKSKRGTKKGPILKLKAKECNSCRVWKRNSYTIWLHFGLQRLPLPLLSLAVSYDGLQTQTRVPCPPSSSLVYLTISGQPNYRTHYQVAWIAHTGLL